MALILSIGFVVDDAIVMLENIVRHIEMGETPMQAALHGSREIGFTIVSMTLSLAAVFIPILFMAGILGRLFREFAVTICAAILISGMVSISLTPMLCSRFLRVRQGDSPRHLLPHDGRRSSMPRSTSYRVSLHWVLHHRPVMLGLFVAVLGVTGYFFVIVQKGFIPDTDNDNYSITVEAAQGTSYYQMVKYQELVSSIVVQDPDVESFYSMTGGGNFGAAGATGRVMVNLLPRRQRKATVADIVQPHPPQAFRHSRACGFRSPFPPPSAWAGACPRAPTITRSTAPIPRNSTTKPPSSSASSHVCPACRKSPAICRSRPRASTSCWTATAPPPCISTGTPSPARSTTPSARSSLPPSTHPPISTACCSKCCPATRNTPTGST